MEMDEMLSNSSTTDEVAKFFVKKCQISEEIVNNIKRENITGDILPLLSKDEFKSLGFKFGHTKTWKNYFEENKDKFPEEEIKENISNNSTKEEIQNFLERCLNYNGPLNDINGKQLMDLNEESMKNFGLNLGQRKKLIKYINYFKSLNILESSGKGDEDIIITRESNAEDVANFLKAKLKFSKESIDVLNLNGEKLYNLQEEQINQFNISQEEKMSLKNYLKELKTNDVKKMKITKESNYEEVAIFLKLTFGISDDDIQYLGLKGDTFLTTTEEEIDDLEISEEQKTLWKNYLKEQNSKNISNITEESSKEEVKIFLKNELSFSVSSFQNIDFDGKGLLQLKESQIKDLDIKKEEKIRLINYLKNKQTKIETINNNNNIQRTNTFIGQNENIDIKIKNF